MRITEITDGIIDEAVNPENIDLSSFKVKSDLNPKIFDSNQKMHPVLKSRLIMIADDFFDTLELPWVDVTDITLTGSLANYNWPSKVDQNQPKKDGEKTVDPANPFNGLVIR